MPSLHVPNELLEQIFDLIHDKSAEPTPESQQTFASLARTSKLFLPLARSYLYYRPISPLDPVAWSKTLCLISSLASPLGQLVVSLEGITEFVTMIGTLDESLVALPFSLTRHTKTFSIYCKILSSFANLAFLELFSNSTLHLPEIFDALKHSAHTLKTIKFTGLTLPPCASNTLKTVLSALKSKELRKAENLVFDGIATASNWNNAPSVPLPLKTISIRNPFGSLHSVKQYFPLDPSKLTSFSFETSRIDVEDLDWIFDCLPSTLKKVSLAVQDWSSTMRLVSYFERIPTHALPSLDFSRFPVLTHLSLRGFSGPSLSLINNLASHSPNLSSIDFSGCTCIYSSISTLTKDSILNLVDPRELLSRLLELKQLLRAHLGFLPTRQRETYKAVEEEIKAQRRVQVEWDLCY
ncbi:hypothetical protein JCM3765_003827 [Sporobolomyces pararoseus]